MDMLFLGMSNVMMQIIYNMMDVLNVSINAKKFVHCVNVEYVMNVIN